MSYIYYIYGMERPVAFITGASRGIGKATAHKFAASGFNLAINSSGAEKLNATAKELKRLFGCEVLCVPGDLSQTNVVATITGQVRDRFGRIDALINNAAWRTIGSLRTIDADVWQKTLAINLTAPAFLARDVALFMEKQKISGTIVNVGSVMSRRVAGTSPAYVACKGALESLTKEMAVTFGGSGIRVVCVAPGFIDTEMSADYTDDRGESIAAALASEMIAFTPLGRPGTSEEVAELIYWLCSSAAAFITGTSITADGGFMANFNSYSIKKRMFPNQY